MTPLEELQAAHKRLSELRDRTTTYVNFKGDSNVVGAGAGDVSSPHIELRVTLHRTIDAQLAILSDPIVQIGGVTRAMPSAAELTLARAINGGTE